MSDSPKKPTEDSPTAAADIPIVASFTAAADAVAPKDCSEAVMEAVDSCVACVDNIDAQHRFEEKLEQHEQHGLTPQETAQMRLEVMEDHQDELSSSFIPDLDELNICGTDDLEDAKTTLNHSTHQQPTREVRSTSPTLQCAICFDDVKRFQNTSTTFCYLPCCGSDGREATSTTKICTACILLLSSPTSDGSARIGRCPRCRSWIVVKDSGLSIEQVDTAGKCQICNQVKGVLVENNNVCDACFLGRQRPLIYECQQCHGAQRIPHPMYRYQASVDSFSTTSWACQGACQNFTVWRILPDQVKYIPAGDAPQEWGDDYLEVARERVMEARRNMLELSRQHGGSGDGCVIQ